MRFWLALLLVAGTARAAAWRGTVTPTDGAALPVTAELRFPVGAARGRYRCTGPSLLCHRGGGRMRLIRGPWATFVVFDLKGYTCTGRDTTDGRAFAIEYECGAGTETGRLALLPE